MPFDGINIFKDSENAVQLVEKTSDTEKTAPVFAEAVVFEEMRMTVRDERSKTGSNCCLKYYRLIIQPKKKTKCTKRWVS